MKVITSLFKNLIFISTLMLCTACEKDLHDFFYFINHSDDPVWVFAASYNIIDFENFRPGSFDYNINAHDTLQIAPRDGRDWEGALYNGMRLVVCIYDKSLSAKPESESYKEFAQKHLLKENWYTLEELNEMNWEIHYYPETNSDNGNLPISYN